MYLFFDGVSSEWYIWLFSEEKKCIASSTVSIAGNESTKTISVIESFLQKQKVPYKDIKNIVTVIGPGSFTGIRTISLVVNTLAYIYPHIFLTPINFFELYSKYPIIKSSSKRDLFVKWKKSATIEVVSNQDFEQRYLWEEVYGDINLERFTQEIELSSERDYETIFQKIELQNLKRIAPLYIKKPNIS